MSQRCLVESMDVTCQGIASASVAQFLQRGFERVWGYHFSTSYTLLAFELHNLLLLVATANGGYCALVC